MKDHTINIKQDNMLCHKCLLNVVKALSLVEGIHKLDVNLELKKIKISYDNEKFTQDKIKEIINEAILRGKVNINLFI